MNGENIIFKLLFGDNVKPFSEKIDKDQISRYKLFWETQGSILIDRWQNKIRLNMYSLLNDEPDCDCKTCSKIKELKVIINMLAEVQTTLNKE